MKMSKLNNNQLITLFATAIIFGVGSAPYTANAENPQCSADIAEEAILLEIKQVTLEAHCYKLVGIHVENEQQMGDKMRKIEECISNNWKKLEYTGTTFNHTFINEQASTMFLSAHGIQYAKYCIADIHFVITKWEGNPIKLPTIKRTQRFYDVLIPEKNAMIINIDQIPITE